MRKVTICLLVRDGNVLLGKKNGGRGNGHRGGYGGGLNPDERPKKAACREIFEESRVVVKEKALKKQAVIRVHKMSNDREFEIHVYVIRHWNGKPKSTSEMRDPRWFSIERLPFDDMWPTDKMWLPWILAGRRFRATFETEGTTRLVQVRDVKTFGS